jgi:hypothetical protein
MPSDALLFLNIALTFRHLCFLHLLRNLDDVVGRPDDRQKDFKK